MPALPREKSKSCSKFQNLGCQQIAILPQESIPLFPALLCGVGKWCETTLVGDEQKIWANEDQLFHHELKLGLLVRPCGGIVEWIPSIVVADLNRYIALGQDVFEKVRVTSSADGVDDVLSLNLLQH
jgi:hypothetical protein